MAIEGTPSLVSRLVRGTFLVAASVASIATFGSEPTWELHAQVQDKGTDLLSTAIPSWSDDFRASGKGTGARRVRFDGAVEVTPSASLASPVQVRVRFVPIGGGAMVEKTVFVTGPTVFSAVDFDVECAPDVTCIAEGTLTVELVDSTGLGADTLGLHWVATSSLYGLGPAVPADGTVGISQP